MKSRILIIALLLAFSFTSNASLQHNTVSARFLQSPSESDRIIFLISGRNLKANTMIASISNVLSV